MIRVRTTIQPELDLFVTPGEHLDLKVQGLLLPGHTGEEYSGEVPEPKLPRGARPNTTDQEG